MLEDAGRWDVLRARLQRTALLLRLTRSVVYWRFVALGCAVFPMAALAATLTGTVRPAGTTRAPANVQIRLRPTSGAEIRCSAPVVDGVWRCEAPAGEYDIEVRAAGFAPSYRWSLVANETRAAVVDLITLEHGVALSGRVVDTGGTPVEGARITIAPATLLTGKAAARTDFRSRHMLTNAKGAFGWSDLPAGTFTIAVEKEGLAPLKKRITVDAATQTLAPLVVTRFSTARVIVSPPVDFYGNPWRIELARHESPDPRFIEIVRSGEADVAGVWDARLLRPGTYRLRVVTSHDEPAHQAELEIANDPILPIAVNAIPVEGLITLDRDPILADVRLVKGEGTTTRFTSDAEGKFRGFVSEEGTYRASIAMTAPPLELHLAGIVVRRRPSQASAHVEIALPAGKLRGSVVDRRGNGVAGTVLLLHEGRLAATITSASSGSFEAIGLHKEAYVARAMTSRGSSRDTAVDAGDDGAKYTIVISESAKRSIRLLDASGNPLLGASIIVKTPAGDTQRLTTGLAGEAAVSLSEDDGAVAYAVVTEGYARKIGILDMSGDLTVIRMSPRNARLRLRVQPNTPWPLVGTPGVTAFALPTLFVLRPAGPPVEYAGDESFVLPVEPGAFTVCPTAAPSGACAAVTVGPGETVTVGEKDGRWQ